MVAAVSPTSGCNERLIACTSACTAPPHQEQLQHPHTGFLKGSQHLTWASEAGVCPRRLLASRRPAADRGGLPLPGVPLCLGRPAEPGPPLPSCGVTPPGVCQPPGVPAGVRDPPMVLCSAVVALWLILRPRSSRAGLRAMWNWGPSGPEVPKGPSGGSMRRGVPSSWPQVMRGVWSPPGVMLGVATWEYSAPGPCCWCLGPGCGTSVSSAGVLTMRVLVC